MCAAEKQATKLSLVIVAFNEERTLPMVLAAAHDVADEIILVDSGSVDRTVEIAESFGAKVVHQDWLGYAAQKNLAVSLASHEWVLSLDADEVLTEGLQEEIKQILGSQHLDRCAGYLIPRLLYIGDRAVAHGGFYPDAQLRLFARSKGRFNERAVHERVFVDGPVGSLQQSMNHYSYSDTGQFAEAMNKYAQLSAQHYLKAGYTWWQVSLFNEIVHPLWTFIYRYVIRAGFADGLLGLKVNLIYSDYVHKKIFLLRSCVHLHK